MPRPAKFTSDQILDAARTLLVDGGTTGPSAAGVARALGAPSGSLYHRFSGRDHLVGTVWLRAVLRFQQGWIEALQRTEPLDAAVAAARHVVRWSRINRTDAAVLARYSLEDVLVGEIPDDLADAVRAQRSDAADALQRFRIRHRVPRRHLPWLRLAVVGIPYAVVRDAMVDPGEPTVAHEEIAAQVATALLAPLFGQDAPRSRRKAPRTVSRSSVGQNGGSDARRNPP